MSTVSYLIRTKSLLTWRMYTRNTIVSIETIVFILAYILWLYGSWWSVRRFALWGAGFIPMELFFADIFTFVLIIWLFFSLVGYRMNEGYDLNRFRIYPLPLRSIFAANLFGAMFDISVLLPFVTFLAAWYSGWPDISQFIIGLFLIIWFLFFCVLCSQTVVVLLYVLLPRLNMVKVGMAVLIALLIWSVLMASGNFSDPSSFFNFFILFRPKGIEHFRPYPGGLIGISLGAVLDGRWGEMWAHLGGFAGWTALLLSANYVLHMLWMDSDQKARIVSERVAKDDLVPVILNFIEKIFSPFINPAARAVYRKDMMEFAFRNPYFMIFKFLPGSIAPVIIVLSMKWNMDPMSGLINSPEGRTAATLGTTILVLFIVISQANLFSGNQFGSEDKTIRQLMLFPTSRGNLLLGKNLFYGGLFIFDALVISFLSLIFWPVPYIFFATFFLITSILILVLSIGNFTSSIWPYWMPLDKASFTLRSTIILSLVNTGSLLALVIIGAFPIAAIVLPKIYDLTWLSYLMMPIALFYSILFHRLTLPVAMNLLESNEFLLLRRIADQEEL